MSKNKLTTCDKEKPTFLSQRTVFLTLIAEEIRSYGIAHFANDYLKLPASLAVDYLKFNKTYWSTLETCIRNFDGMTLKNLEDSKDEITKIYEKETKSAIKRTLEHIDDKVSTKDQELPFITIQNVHVPEAILKLFRKRAIERIKREELEDNVNQVKINLRDLPTSTINSLEVKIKDIAQNWLMIDSIDMAIRRAKLTNKNVTEDKDKKYRFKKFRNDSKEIFEDFMYDLKDKFQIAKLDNKNAQIISEASKKYEIIGKQLYLINQRKFKKTLGQYFRPRLNKLRKKHGKPESN